MKDSDQEIITDDIINEFGRVIAQLILDKLVLQKQIRLYQAELSALKTEVINLRNEINKISETPDL